MISKRIKPDLVACECRRKASKVSKASLKPSPARCLTLTRSAHNYTWTFKSMGGSWRDSESIPRSCQLTRLYWSVYNINIEDHL